MSYLDFDIIFYELGTGKIYIYYFDYFDEKFIISQELELAHKDLIVDALRQTKSQFLLSFYGRSYDIQKISFLSHDVTILNEIIITR